MRFSNLLIFFFAIISPLSIFSQNGGGQSIYKFLDIPVSARVSALGGNLLSTKDNDLNVAINNPALLSDSMDNNVILNYVNYFSDINFYYAGYAKSLKKYGVVSTGVQYMDYGKFLRADEFGNKEGVFGASDMSINLSYATTVFDSNLFVGATLKTIYSQMDTYYSWGSAVDLGMVYARPSGRFAIAYVIKNAGKQWKPYTVGNYEKLPFEMQIGISNKPKHVPFRFSLTYENLEKWDLTYSDPNNPNATKDPLTGKPIKKSKAALFGDKLMRHIVIGGEMIITKNFFLRAGYNYQRRKELKIDERRGMTGFTFGFGFKVYKFNLSYARASYHLAGASNNFSVTFDINNFYSKKNQVVSGN